MKVIYLDNNATTKVAPEVIETMMPYFSEYYGNPSSMHSFGGDVAAKIKESRASVARLIGAGTDEIIFTSCGTESDSSAIRAALEAADPGKNHIITSRVEHPAIKSLYESLAKKGYRVTFVPVDGAGRLDVDYLYQYLSDDTALVSLMWANNETGVIFPIEEVSRRIKEKGILFHTDAVQAVGKISIDVSRTGVDMLSLSGHHATFGVRNVLRLVDSHRRDVEGRVWMLRQKEAVVLGGEPLVCVPRHRSNPSDFAGGPSGAPPVTERQSKRRATRSAPPARDSAA